MYKFTGEWNDSNRSKESERLLNERGYLFANEVELPSLDDKPELERYLRWKSHPNGEARKELSEEALKAYYDIYNFLAIEALKEQSSK